MDFAIGSQRVCLRGRVGDGSIILGHFWALTSGTNFEHSYSIPSIIIPTFDSRG